LELPPIILEDFMAQQESDFVIDFTPDDILEDGDYVRVTLDSGIVISSDDMD
jgi:hypothetical protein